MWVMLALVAALGSASTGLVLKQAVGHGGIVVSTVAFRAVAGLMLVGVVMAVGAWPQLTPTYWWATALVIPPEVIGMVLYSMALRAGDLSLVQPMMGLVPLCVMLGGGVFLNEVPAPLAGVGVVSVTAGVYCVGLQAGGSVWEPLRALARTRASWYALGAVACWSLTTLLHKVGIAEVGPFPWAVTLTLGSAAALAVALPVLGRRSGTLGVPGRKGAWTRFVALAGLFFAVQQIGLHLALRIAQAGYVIAITSTSTLIATAFGIALLGERAGARNRIIGALLVSAGAVLIALFG